MGYPVEKIDKETELFVYVGPNAIEEERDTLFNRHFREADVNKTVMPLNIREEDLGFFIHNFKNSKIRGGYFAQPYWELLHTLLDDLSEEARRCGLVDTIGVENGAYIPDVTLGRAVVELLEERSGLEGKKVAIIGATPASKSVLWHLRDKNPTIITLMDEIVEAAAGLEALAEGKVATDIERIQEKKVLLEDTDIVIDAFGIYPPVCKTDPECIITLRDAPCHLYQESAGTHLQFDQIFAKIAQIKTREWNENE